MKFKTFTLLAVLAPLSMAAYSKESAEAEDHEMEVSTVTLRLADVLDAARRDNPQILAARKRWESALAQISQDQTPEKPRIDIERMYAPRGQNIWSDANEKNVAVTQEIPFPTTLYYKGRVARKAAEAAEAAYQGKEDEILAKVKEAFILLFLSRHNVHVVEANADLMREFSKVAEAKYAAGRSSQGDVLKAQVELSKMLNLQVNVQQDQETSAAMLNSLLNREPASPLGAPEELKSEQIRSSLADLERIAEEHQPALLEMARTVEKGEASVSVARSTFWPDLMLGYRRRDMMNGPDSQDVLVGFSVPLWFWKQNAASRQAEADREAALADLQTTRNMTRFSVKDLMVKCQANYRLIELYRTSVLPQAEQAMKVAEVGYQSDRIGFLDVLDAARSLLNFRMEYYQSVADYQRAFAELERVTGVNLKENQL